VDALEAPSMISVGVSGQRMNAALSAGVLEPVADAAVSAGAGNSIEKMLCHHGGSSRSAEARGDDARPEDEAKGSVGIVQLPRSGLSRYTGQAN